MYIVVVSVKIKKGKMEEAWSQAKENMEESQGLPPGLHYVTVLVNHNENKILKIHYWESESHAKVLTESKAFKDHLSKSEYLLDGPPTIEYYDTVVKISSQKIYAGVL